MIFSAVANGCMNVGTMDTPMDIEYESGDYQAIIRRYVTLDISCGKYPTITCGASRI